MNIREGDILVVGANEYPIRSVAEWATTRLVETRTFIKQATVVASTKRSPAVVSGKRGAPVTLLSNLKCTPLDPIDPQLRQRLALDTPHELMQTFLADEIGFVQLIVEELKR